MVGNQLIIGVETLHPLNKERLLMHQHRLSVEMYQDFNNEETLNTILVQQCSVDDIPGSFVISKLFQITQ